MRKKPSPDRLASLREKLPTLFNLINQRREAARNRLPKHLRPPSRGPILVQLALNAGLIVVLCTIMLNKDDYVSEAGPAIALIVCLLFLIGTVATAVHYRKLYRGTPLQRWAKLNFGFMVVALLCWPAAIYVYLP